MTKLANRLWAVTQLVREGTTLADIGTDHAHLPIFLSANNRIKYAVASDIGVGPLENARKEVESAQAVNIELRLGNGLEPIKQGEVKDIVIAGMGGENISGILEACDWVRDENLNFILQPMTRIEYLRRYLCANGFKIYREICVSENGKHYCIIGTVFDGIVRECDSVFALIGTLSEKSDMQSFEYIKMQLNKQKLILSELVKSDANGEKLSSVRDTVLKLERICNDYSKRCI